MAGVTHDRYGLRTSIYRGEKFLLGGKSGGYSIHRQGGGWTSTVWYKGSAARSDVWDTEEKAVSYALGRARQYGWSARAIAKAAAC